MPSPWPPPAPPCIPVQFSAFLHALLAPKELAAVDALGGPRTPAVPMGAQRVAGQALAHCSEEGGIRRGHSREVPGSSDPGEEAGVGAGDRGPEVWGQVLGNTGQTKS